MNSIRGTAAVEPSLAYMPQLDGLRAFAVSAVLIHHLLDPGELPQALASIPLGFLGVKLFFVLSGFLITSLLLKARAEACTSTKTQVLQQFYVRRTLRIFPLYYFVLAVALFLGPADAREQLPWLATYTYNFWIANLGWWTAHFSHFWSLCVEEQFYLLWPWIVLYAPRRHLAKIFLGVILAGPAYRWLAIGLEWNGLAFYAVPLSSFDALGMGSLLALASAGQAPIEAVETIWRRLGFGVGAGGLVVLHAIEMSTGAALPEKVLFDTSLALIFAWFVSAASRGSAQLLAARPLVYLGRISYGIYVYHLFVPELLHPVFAFLGLPIQPKEVTHFAISCAVTIAMASLSWHILERPIIRLRRHIVNSSARPPTVGRAGEMS